MRTDGEDHHKGMNHIIRQTEVIKERKRELMDVTGNINKSNAKTIGSKTQENGNSGGQKQHRIRDKDCYIRGMGGRNKR